MADAANTPAAADPAPPGESLLGRIGRLAMDLLPALIGAISTVGFVAFVGAAIAWIRFETAELPAARVVSVMPRSELIVSGATMLVPFAVFGIAAVVTVYLLDRRGEATNLMRRGIVALAVVEVLLALLFAHLDLWVLVGIAVWLIAVGIFGAEALNVFADRRAALERLERAVADYREKSDAARAATDEVRLAEQFTAGMTRHWRHRLNPPSATIVEREVKAREQAERARMAEQVSLDKLRKAVTQTEDLMRRHETSPDDQPRPATQRAQAADTLARAEELLADQRLVYGEDRLASKERLRKLKWHRWAALVAGIACCGAALIIGTQAEGVWWLIAAGLATLFFMWALPSRLFPLLLLIGGLVFMLAFDNSVWLAVTTFVVIVLAAGLLAVARATERFWPYGLAVFVSIPIIGLVVLAMAFTNEPRLEPAAVIRTGDGLAVCGVYLTETKDRVYLGRVQRESRTSDDAEPNSGRIFWIPTKDVDMLRIGAPQPLEDVEDKAVALMREVYRDRAEEHAQALKARTTKTTVTTPKAEEQAKGTTSTESTREGPSELGPPRRKPIPRPAALAGIAKNCQTG